MIFTTTISLINWVTRTSIYCSQTQTVYAITLQFWKPNLSQFINEHKANYDTSNLTPNIQIHCSDLCSVKTIVKNWVNLNVKLDRLLPRNLSAFDLRCSLKVEGMKKLTAKGIKRSFIKHHITHQVYVNTLRTARPTEAEFLAFA